MAFLTRVFTPPTTERIPVNLNAITHDGLIRIRASRFPHGVAVGDLVSISEPEEEVEGLAHVAEVNESTGLVYLDVVWESLRDTEVAHVAVIAGAATTADLGSTGWPSLCWAVS